MESGSATPLRKASEAVGKGSKKSPVWNEVFASRDTKKVGMPPLAGQGVCGGRSRQRHTAWSAGVSQPVENASESIIFLRLFSCPSSIVMRFSWSAGRVWVNYVERRAARIGGDPRCIEWPIAAA
jgi:hypothetical protein